MAPIPISAWGPMRPTSAINSYIPRVRKLDLSGIHLTSLTAYGKSSGTNYQDVTSVFTFLPLFYVGPDPPASSISPRRRSSPPGAAPERQDRPARLARWPFLHARSGQRKSDSGFLRYADAIGHTVRRAGSGRVQGARGICRPYVPRDHTVRGARGCPLGEERAEHRQQRGRRCAGAAGIRPLYLRGIPVLQRHIDDLGSIAGLPHQPGSHDLFPCRNRLPPGWA